MEHAQIISTVPAAEASVSVTPEVLELLSAINMPLGLLPPEKNPSKSLTVPAPTSRSAPDRPLLVCNPQVGGEG